MAVQTNRPKLKTAFKKSRTIAPIYTNGPVASTPDGKWLITCLQDIVLVTDISNGAEICRFAGDTQVINSLCVTPSSRHLITFSSSLSLKIYELPDSSVPQKRIQPIRTIARAHDSSVHVCKADPTSSYLASGSADGVVKVWDILRGYVTHVFKGHGGVVSALTFDYPQDISSATQRNMRLITASVDTRIRIFNLSTEASTSSGAGKAEAVLEGHVSVPRGLDVSADGRWLVSGGRDSVVLLWDLLYHDPSVVKQDKRKKGKAKATTPMLVKTIPVLERVEAVGILNPEDLPSSSSSDIHFYTGGEKGVVKIWNANQGDVIFTLGNVHAQRNANTEEEEQRQIVDILYLRNQSTLISIHADQNIILYSTTTKSLTKQLIGYNDEIVDSTYLEYKPPSSSKKTPETVLALATNSSLIRVYSSIDYDSRLIEGHTDIVLALDHSADGQLLASGSKDRSARIWAPTLAVNEAGWGYDCVALCEGHAESVGAVAMSRKPIEDGVQSRFLFTGSQDKTIKMWDLTGIPSSKRDEGDILRCKSLTTHKAHEKDINSLDVSPNDRLLVSASQDKTAKVFQIEFSYSKGNETRGELKLLGTCKGHKRGVWTARFGRTERLLATGSGDKTVKLWSLDDFSCLKTFEGHTNSVLRVDFFNVGMQLVSSASDGLVKLWDIATEECVATLDNHEDKIWALTVDKDERTIVSGAADSIVTFWVDCTEEQEDEKELKRAEMVLKDQDLANYIALHDYKKAIQLALAMKQPGRLLSIFKNILSSQEEAKNSDPSIVSADELVKSLSRPDLAKLLCYVRDWNTNVKTSEIAQTLLFTIVKLWSASDIINAFEDDNSERMFSDGEVVTATKGQSTGYIPFKELIEALLPYTERHLSRMDKLVQDSYVVDYILGEMDDGLVNDDYSDEIMEVDL